MFPSVPWKIFGKSFCTEPMINERLPLNSTHVLQQQHNAFCCAFFLQKKQPDSPSSLGFPWLLVKTCFRQQDMFSRLKDLVLMSLAQVLITLSLFLNNFRTRGGGRKPASHQPSTSDELTSPSPLIQFMTWVASEKQSGNTGCTTRELYNKSLVKNREDSQAKTWFTGPLNGVGPT